MDLQKKPPYRNQKYLDFVKMLPCSICYIKDSTIAPHHTTSRGAGGGDDTAISLCAYHHNAYHNYGRETFAKFYKINIEDLIRLTQNRWEGDFNEGSS